MAITAFVTATLLLLLSGVPGLLCRRSAKSGERLALVLVVAGAFLGIAAVLQVLGSGATARLQAPWNVPGGAIALRLDGIAAAFLLPAYLIAALGALYGLGYWPQATHPENGRRLRLFFGLITGAVTLVVTAANALFFLAAWETMALSGFFLVTTEQKREEARRAGYIYLAATHVGTLALFAMFILLSESSGGFDFPGIGTLPADNGIVTAVFCLALFGFGVKAGLMPLHVWLPGAHAAAPSHISALLSGVMIKTGIYGLVRITGFFAVIPPWWGWTVLTLGAVSGVMGVVFAIAQHDLKRLLAYHSVENIGIITIGFGLALLGRSYGLPALTLLGLAGALLHVINHGLFKSLLFFGAGAVVHATGSREIDRHGGLLRSMPVTGVCFLGGAVAISGLPPLNGFISEWLIYLGSLQALQGERILYPAVVAAPVLALIGALALACFVKVFGILFLGEARTPAAETAHEAPGSMRLPMRILLTVCFWIGTLPGSIFPLLTRAAADWCGPSPSDLLAVCAPAGTLALCSLVLLLLIAILFLWRRRQVREAPRTTTWGCGYARPAARMQYTASSFAEQLVGLFRWGLRPERHGGEVAGLLPQESGFTSHTPDTVLDRLILPLGRAGASAGTWLRARMQHGISGFYLLYVALTLCTLLLMLVRG